MRILKVDSSLTPKGKAHVWGFQFFARAVQVIAGLALILTVQTTAPAATSSAQDSKSNSAQISSRDWVCPADKRIPADQYNTKGVEQGVAEAVKLLENCAACREFFGDFDAVTTLKRLMKMRAIIVSDVMPNGLPLQDKVEWVPVKETAAAITIDYSRRTKKTFFKPCIYVNPKKFLVVDETSVKGFGLEGLPLAQARGVAILHELAHIADVIPSDGSAGMSAEMSIRNTLCIRKKCMICDTKPCVTIASYLITDRIHSYTPYITEVGSRKTGFTNWLENRVASLVMERRFEDPGT